MTTPASDGRPTTRGTLALVGGSEWTEGCTFDAELLAGSGADQIVVLPTAAAYQQPERVVMTAAEWFGSLGAAVQGLMVVSRSDAQDPAMARIIREARFVYLSDGSPMHLRSVLKGSLLFKALQEAWRAGAVVAGSGAGAMVLSDPMVDPRGGALTVGLGMIDQLAVVPHFGAAGEDTHGEKLHRSLTLAPKGSAVVGVPERTALILESGEAWRSSGAGAVSVFLDGVLAEGGVASLPRP